jgi:hypothetical protein
LWSRSFLTRIAFKWCVLWIFILQSFCVRAVMTRITHLYKYKCIKNYTSSISLFMFCIICSLIAIHKSSKCTKLFWMMSTIRLCYNRCILEPLWHKSRWMIDTTLKMYFSLFEFYIIFCPISIYKITEIRNVVLNNVFDLFI